MAEHPHENVIQSLFSLAARQLDPEQLTNGVVCGLKQDQRKGTQFWPDLRKALCLAKKISESELLTESLQASVVRVSRQYSVLYKKRTRTGGQAKFDAFQQTKFNLPQRSGKKRVAKIDLPNTTPSKIAKFDDKVKTLTYDSLLRDCRQLTLRLKTTEEELIKVRKSNQQLSNENKTLKQKLSTWCPKRANFKLSRSKESTKTWRQKYNSATKKLGSFSQLHEKLTSTERDKKSLKRSASKTKYKMKKQKEKLIEKRKHENVTKQFEKTVTTLKSKLKKTKDNALYFETQVASSAEDNLDGENCIAPVLIRTKEGNSYTKTMRRAMYKCISCQVPVKRVSAL